MPVYTCKTLDEIANAVRSAEKRDETVVKVAGDGPWYVVTRTADALARSVVAALDAAAGRLEKRNADSVLGVRVYRDTEGER